MSNLDDQIREHYNSCCLDSHRLSAILCAGEQCSQSRMLMRWSFGLAAALIVITTVLNLGFPVEVGERTPDRIITEVAKSHSNLLDPEYFSTNYQELQSQLARIDFSIVPTDFLKDNYRLVGARYCSIHTCLAVQLRLRDKQTGEPVTLYIAKLDSALAQAQEDLRVVDGVRVQVWKDTDRFFAMARGGQNTLGAGYVTSDDV